MAIIIGVAILVSGMPAATAQPTDLTDSSPSAEVTVTNGVVTITYHNLDTLDEFEFRTGQSQIRVIRSTGLEYTPEIGEWRPELGADTVTIQYRVKQQSASFEARDDWAFVPIPRGDYSTNIDYTGSNIRVYENTAYIGPHTTYTAQATGQDISLTVPKAVDTQVNGTKHAEDLASFADSLRFGTKQPTYSALILPDDSLTNRVGYYDDSVVPTVTEMSSGDYHKITLLHEYVHHRYIVGSGPQMRWWNEGIAQYYAVTYAVEYGYITTEERNQRFHKSDTVTLGNTSTWDHIAQYEKGTVVAAAFDAHVRETTGGEKTLQDVMQRLDDSSTITLSKLKQAMTETTGVSESAGVVDLYVTTDAMPQTWEPVPFYIQYAVEITGSALVILLAVGAAAYERRQR